MFDGRNIPSSQGIHNKRHQNNFTNQSNPHFVVWFTGTLKCGSRYYARSTTLENMVREKEPLTEYLNFKSNPLINCVKIFKYIFLNRIYFCGEMMSVAEMFQNCRFWIDFFQEPYFLNFLQRNFNKHFQIVTS